MSSIITDFKNKIQFKEEGSQEDYENVEEIIIDYNGYENDFNLTITYDHEELNGQDTRFFRYDVMMMISEVLETDSWNEEGGGFGTMKLYDKNSNGYLYHTWEERHVTKGEPIILTQEEFLAKPFVNLGFYRANITPKKNYLFVKNMKDVYTNFEMEYAKKNGFDIKMIEDGKTNFIFYWHT